jgi:hypothetical protein
MTKHFMIDIETWGIEPYSTIIEIGAVCFDPNSALPWDKFTVAIDPISAQAAGLRVDASTVLWWMQREQTAARDLWLSAGKIDLRNALDGLTYWMAELRRIEHQNNFEDCAIWGCGPDFDNLLLKCAYTAVNHELPWGHRDNRCFRTMKNLPLSHTCQPDFQGVPHRALDDALHQAAWLSNIVARHGLTL